MVAKAYTHVQQRDTYTTDFLSDTDVRCDFFSRFYLYILYYSYCIVSRDYETLEKTVYSLLKDR